VKRPAGGLIIVAAAFLLLVCGCEHDSGAPSAENSDLAATRQNRVRFYREYVTVEPSATRTTVTALYYFRNDSDESTTVGILYPFPIDRNHLYPFQTKVWEERHGCFEPIGFVRAETDVKWTMSFTPREEKLIKVRYVQEIRKHRAIYIVTTTKLWEQPIEIAEFEFRIPVSFEGVELSFIPDRTESHGDTVVHYKRYTDFFPDEDLTVSWD
jgi:hypothetical protein